jgi:methyltransferase (TIGR00027 family)
VRKDQASSTGLLIAAAMVLLRRDTRTSALVSTTTAELGERILETHSAGTQQLRRVIHQHWFQPVATWIERLTIPGIMCHYALRKKCLAGLVRTALNRGTEQVIVLGAGFDGCALELSREYPQVRFWEIDHPATQQWKERILDEIERDRIQLIPADLSLGSLPTDALAATQFNPKAASFWMAEGLLMYFPETVVQALIRSITSLTTPGSGVAFSLMEKRDDGRIRFQRQSKLVDWWLGHRSEPFLWAGSRDEVRTLLQSWPDITFFDHDDLRKLGQLDREVPLAAGEIICSANR